MTRTQVSQECYDYHYHYINIAGESTASGATAATAPMPGALTTCNVHPCATKCRPEHMSVVDILDDLKSSTGHTNGGQHCHEHRPMSGLAVACPKAPCIRFALDESQQSSSESLILGALIRRLVAVRKQLELTAAKLSLTLW